MKKHYRVKKNQDIETIINKRDTVGDRFFVIYKLENHDYKHFRYAVSVNKKYGNAVERNKVKRRVRAVVDKFKEHIKNNNDLFIVIKNNSNSLTYEEIESKLIKLLKRNNSLEEYNNAK